MPGNRSHKANRILLVLLTGTLVLSSIPLVHAAPPVAGFTYEPADPSTADTVYFNSTSTDDHDNITNLTWDMGDGTILYGAQVTHRYGDDGIYTVTLNVTDNETFYDTYTETVTVANLGPTAGFSYTPAAPSTGDNITFTDTSTDSDGTIANWTWDLGDGNTSYDRNATHRYADNGTYTVNLTVTDDDGATDSHTTTITVSNVGPTAGFSYTPAAPATGDNITFTDTSTDSDGTIANWTWDLGDGNTSYDRNATHRYDHNGTYTVTLDVTDDDGATDSHTLTISVANRSPIAAFDAAPETVQTAEEVTFTDASSDADGTIANWTWDLGDGNRSYLRDLTHAYADDGAYTVTLTVTDDDGATNSTTRTVNVTNRAPTVSFAYSPTVVYTTADATFTANATDPDGSIVSYMWDFGDGTPIQTGDTTSHDFNGTGTFVVTVTVTDDDGATARANQTIRVDAPAGGGGRGPLHIAATALRDATDPDRWVLTKTVYAGTEEVVIQIPDAGFPVDALTLAVSGKGILNVAIERLEAPPGTLEDEGYLLDAPVDIQVDGTYELEHQGGVIRFAVAGAADLDAAQMVVLHGSAGPDRLEPAYQGRDAAGRHIFSVATKDFSPFVLAMDKEGPTVSLPETSLEADRRLVFEVADNRAIDQVVLRIDGTDYSLESDGTRYWSEVLEGLAPGVHEAVIEARDTSGLVTTKAWDLHVGAPAAPVATSEPAPAMGQDDAKAASRETPGIPAFVAAFALIAIAWMVIRRI